jgi:hypothetical protein
MSMVLRMIATRLCISGFAGFAGSGAAKVWAGAPRRGGRRRLEGAGENPRFPANPRHQG